MGTIREEAGSRPERAYRRRLLAVRPGVLLRAVRPVRSPRIVLTEHREPSFLAREPGEIPSARRRASLALGNLRGYAIACVVMMHSSIAYLASAPAQISPIDQPGHPWVAFPIVDARRWLGLDLFCAWQDVYFMSLLFFLSGLFVYTSIERDGPAKFFRRRMARLGVPLVFGIGVLAPLALYPVYRLTAGEPNLADYLAKYLALPFIPCGPFWFLWFLLALTLIVVALWRLLRPAILLVGRLSLKFEERPTRAFVILALISVAAYAPLALLFTPWHWENWGPFAVQLSRIVLYCVYYFAGVAVGAIGLGVGLTRSDGVAARNWKRWMFAAAGSLVLWMGLTGLTLQMGDASPFILNLASDISYALACACSVLFALAFCLRFGALGAWPLLGRLSDDAFGVYVLHYAPVVWLQYELLTLNWPAPIKALVVFLGSGAACLG